MLFIYLNYSLRHHRNMSILPCSTVMIYSLYRKKNKHADCHTAFDSILLSHIGYIQMNLIIRQRISKNGILLAFLLLTFCKRTSTMLVF